MASNLQSNDPTLRQNEKAHPAAATSERPAVKASNWRRLFPSKKPPQKEAGSSGTSTNEHDEIKAKPEKWSMGVLNDKETDEVPGM